MSKKVFLDANILLDKFDDKRLFSLYSSRVYEFLLLNEYDIFTSCDIITTLYYVGSKIDKKKTLLNIQNINKTLKVVEFSNKEIEHTCDLMNEDRRAHV